MPCSYIMLHGMHVAIRVMRSRAMQLHHGMHVAVRVMRSRVSSSYAKMGATGFLHFVI